jgi:hypothetical protein
MPLFVPRTGSASAAREKQGYVGPSQKISRMMIERKAARRRRWGFPHYTTLAWELMFGNELPKSPDALDRKPLARAALQIRRTLPVFVIPSRRWGANECRMTRHDVEGSSMQFSNCSPDARQHSRGAFRSTPKEMDKLR